MTSRLGGAHMKEPIAALMTTAAGLLVLEPAPPEHTPFIGVGVNDQFGPLVLDTSRRSSCASRPRSSCCLSRLPASIIHRGYRRNH